jgi:hypothetical protein
MALTSRLFFLRWLIAFHWASAEKAVQFVVQAFGGAYSAFGGILHLRIIFEGVGVYHVGGFDVDVPCFFFEASAHFNKGADCVKQVEVCYPATPDSLGVLPKAKLHE